MRVTREPFPHLVADGMWDDDLLDAVAAEFPAPDAPTWRRFGNDQELKYEGGPHLWGEATRDLFSRIEAKSPMLATAFGIPGLSMETVGGGYHLIPPGGYLAVHTDFNRSPATQQHRRLNLLVYLNDDWQDDEGGQLELWDTDTDGPARSVAPQFNRTVVFQTSDRSWHGHPRPTTRYRASVAAYFFTEQAPEGYSDEHSTVWHPQGGRRA